MVERMRGWVASGQDALVEAPTGTGKSYALLAVALEWLAADPSNRVVDQHLHAATAASDGERHLRPP